MERLTSRKKRNEKERGGDSSPTRPDILWIIVPYRDREKQLKQWLPRVCQYLHALLTSSSTPPPPGVRTPHHETTLPGGVCTAPQQQKTKAFIAIAEQDDDLLFNKGTLKHSNLLTASRVPYKASMGNLQSASPEQARQSIGLTFHTLSLSVSLSVLYTSLPTRICRVSIRHDKCRRPVHLTKRRRKLKPPA